VLVLLLGALSWHLSSNANAKPQLPVQQALACISKAQPVFQSDCRVRSPLTAAGCPSLPSQQGHEVFDALRGRRLILIGDSTMRRFGHELLSITTRAPFFDGGVPLRVTINETANVAQAAFTIESYWLPTITSLQAHLSAFERTQDPFPALREAPAQFDARVYVLAYGTHDLAKHWTSATELASAHNMLPQWASNVSACVASLLQSPGVQSGRDVIMLRLPIAQCCVSKFFGWFTNLCDYPHQVDPVNQFVAAASDALASALRSAAPSVPVLSMAWTRSPNGFDRHTCAPCDGGGTHFGNAAGRRAFLQQVLYALWMLPRDWPASAE